MAPLKFLNLTTVERCQHGHAIWLKYSSCWRVKLPITQIFSFVNHPHALERQLSELTEVYRKYGLKIGIENKFVI